MSAESSFIDSVPVRANRAGRGGGSGEPSFLVADRRSLVVGEEDNTEAAFDAIIVVCASLPLCVCVCVCVCVPMCLERVGKEGTCNVLCALCAWAVCAWACGRVFSSANRS